ncbi:unnamed protein product [Heterobilharzia americana]|nr:unnamed protein product [Heterobilharzia americana]
MAPMYEVSNCWFEPCEAMQSNQPVGIGGTRGINSGWRLTVGDMAQNRCQWHTCIHTLSSPQRRYTESHHFVILPFSLFVLYISFGCIHLSSSFTSLPFYLM